ncbi:MAG: hypothetical protein AAGC88_14150 [Bacteroidota bacterium]
MKNTFIDWRAITKYGLILSLIVTGVVIFGFMLEPLIFAGDLPKEVQAKIGELPEEVIPLGVGTALIIILSGLTLAILMNKKIFDTKPGQAIYWNFLINGFLFLNFMNLWDLVIIDILIFGLIQPDFMTIEGVEELIREQTTTAFHFMAFFKGQPWMLIIAAISAGINMLIRKKKSSIKVYF